MTNQLTFHDKTLTPIIQDGQTWLTSSDLAKALGYAKSDSVSRIYDRNADEFTPCMSLTVKLTVNGINNSSREKETRIFSLNGCHLIAMFSRTKVAKEFRQWALKILDKESAQPVPEKVESDTVTKHGFTRVLMVFKHEQLVDSYPLKNNDGIVSFDDPKILQQMIKSAMPGYALINKEEFIKAFNL